MTERDRQAFLAYAHTSSMVLRHHFVLATEHGGTFSAIASTQKGALRVMDAEKPGCSISAKYDGATVVPCHRERVRDHAKSLLGQ